ncbi:lysozyme [Vibrio galatheae]|uniref:Lysozyme n=1 Tax=Vibrio galatheae TaxID=579748 RepID=A0A0F4NK90_9VIBR|nr:lysozyme [Vibrio galatheae]KJY83288.1 lysozyme [Vibrio galatheae]
MSLKQKAITSVVCSVVALLGVVTSKAPELTTSEQGLAHILDMEGCRLKAYQCSADRWTIGAGHAHGVNQGDTITLDQAADYFIEDVAKAEKVVKKAITQTPNQGEFDMMVSFVFHMGSGNFQRSTLLKKFNAGLNAPACEQYLRWVYVNGQSCHDPKADCEGIVSRRQVERDVCLTGWN